MNSAVGATNSTRPYEQDLPVEVDVVVVGAGAAGSVLAARLSEDPSCRVLLLEAGTTTGREPAARTPGMAFSLMAGETVWPDMTASQQALGGRQVYLPQGRGLGGASSMNAMAWFQGHPADYDSWQTQGAPGWGWADVQPVLRAVEDSEFGPDAWHGHDGPMRISAARDVSALPLNFVAAGAQMGLTVTGDFNGQAREGIGLFAANLRDGTRHSVVDGYLAPAESRANLQVRTGRHVTGILLEYGRAAGVTCVQGGRSPVTTVRAGAVVLAAGALRTPQLLMLSGIGPAAHLRQHDIAVVHDLPGVGSNLQDHPMVTPTWPVTDGSPLNNAITATDQRNYALLRRGPLASLTQAGAVVSTEAGLDGPDIQITLSLLGMTAGMQLIPDPVVTAAVSLLTPRSRGTLRLGSADPLTPPVADPAYLTDLDDQVRLRAGLRLAKHLFETEPLRAATGAPLAPTDWDDAALQEWVTSNAGTEWHPVGTCRMGSDAEAVVDPHTMQVHGISGLYAADSSVMPTVTRGNTQAPVIMIAERASRRISEHFNDH